MKNSAKLLIAVVITALLGTMAVVVTSNLATPDMAKVLCDAASLRTFAAKGENTDKLRAAYLLQEAEVCELASDSDKAAKKAADEAAAAKAAADKAAKDRAARDKAARNKLDPNNPDNWPRYERELISTRPASEKMSANSFGPMYALHPAFRGKQLDKLSNKEFVEELKYRMPMSPVLTAATGAALNMWPESQVNDKISLFLANKDAWKKAVAQVSARLDKELKDGAHVVTLPAGTYSATYAVADSDGVPHFAVDDNVGRAEPFKAFRLRDGTDLRMICGGQQYTKHHKSAPRMPKPSPGMSRDHEGNPVVLVDVCRFVNGKWKNVFNVTKRRGDLPLNSSKCKPTSPPKHQKKVPVCVDHGGKIILVPPSEAHKYPKPNANGTCAKDPGQDPAKHGNAGNGGGKNRDPGPGAITTPTHAPSTPRTNPSTPTPAPTTSQPTPPPAETGAPQPTAPATGCAPAPGQSSC